MTTYTSVVKHNNGLVDVKYTLDNDSREMKIGSIIYYGQDVSQLFSEQDIENLEIQIANDNE